MIVRRRDVLTWILWIALMIIATAVMIHVRERIDQVHVVLVYLLLILGASTFGGRLLAFPLAGAGFLLIDYYFQQPYGEMSSAKPRRRIERFMGIPRDGRPETDTARAHGSVRLHADSDRTRR